MDTSNKAVRMGLKTAFYYMGKNPDENIPKLMHWTDKLAGDGENSFKKHRDVIRNVINDPDCNMHKLIWSLWDDIDSHVLEKAFENFALNAVLLGWKKEEELRKKYDCNIPWAILLDPTSACNLHCTGCWAAEYGNKLNLSFDEIDSIITQGKEMGVYFYIYTGGEPLVRKNDLIAICHKHNDCMFLTFTNGTLIDDDFTEAMLEMGNLLPALSVEGFESSTDARRGSGTYHKAVRAMNLLKEKRLPFGISCCYTAQNVDSISSEEYITQMVEWGAKFVWYFHYMPVGNEAVPELMPSVEQRKYMYHRVREIRASQPIFAMDFQNDGEYVGGCVAGGRRYLHINAAGDIEPCVFIHYSDANIRKTSLLEALQMPLFKAYHAGQPFNENHLRPCPMLENPEKLRAMIDSTDAHSTDLQSPESAEHLCAKCEQYAADWAAAAEELWEESPRGQKAKLEKEKSCKVGA